MYGGQSTHIPLRVNNAGVIPVIFASSVLTFPLTLAQFIPSIAPAITRWFGIGSVGYVVAYAILVIFFTYFYTAVTFNPVEVANNMRKNGGFIPGLQARQVDVGVPRSGLDPAHVGRSDLPRHDRDPSVLDVGNHAHTDDVLVLWRNEHLDRRRRRVGYDEADRSSLVDAALRRLLEVMARGCSARALGLAGASGCGQGYPG